MHAANFQPAVLRTVFLSFEHGSAAGVPDGSLTGALPGAVRVSHAGPVASIRPSGKILALSRPRPSGSARPLSRYAFSDPCQWLGYGVLAQIRPYT